MILVDKDNLKIFKDNLVLINSNKMKKINIYKN